MHGKILTGHSRSFEDVSVSVSVVISVVEAGRLNFRSHVLVTVDAVLSLEISHSTHSERINLINITIAPSDTDEEDDDYIVNQPINQSFWIHQPWAIVQGCIYFTNQSL